MKLVPLAVLIATLGFGVGCHASNRVEDRALDESPSAPAESARAVCRSHMRPVCATLNPAPTSEEGVREFVREVATPLRCELDGAEVWTLDPLVEAYGDNKVFMLGEVHGSNEIGVVSARLFERLGRAGLVTVLGYEFAADYGAALERYVEGSDEPIVQTVLDALAKNDHRRILTEEARGLHAAGIPIRVAPVDIPSAPSWAAAQLRDVAGKLSTHRAKVLAAIPSVFPDDWSAAQIAELDAGFDGIVSDETAICSELSADDCDRLDAMAHALWASARLRATGRDELWFERREVFIYWAMRAAMDADARMYLHMGAAHTTKSSGSAGSRMANEWPPTKGRVFSVAPAYDDGSLIDHAGLLRLPATPPSIAGALGATKRPYFVALAHPSASCEASPLGAEPIAAVAGISNSSLCRDAYDGYLYYGGLTPRSLPESSSLTRRGPDDWWIREAFRRYTADIAARELAFGGPSVH